MATAQRDSAAAAEAVMSKAYPDPYDRFVVLRQLLSSSEKANALAPNAWGVTLLKNGFRLNVGVTEVLIGYQDGIGINLAGKPGDFEASEGCQLREVNYAARPGSTRYDGYVDDFELAAPDLEAAHAAFIVACAHSPSGKPYAGSPNQRFHNSGLMAYARTFVAEFAHQLAEQSIDPAPDEVLLSERLIEGGHVQVLVNAYERNTRARKICIEHYGMRCVVCGFKFSEVYGSAAETYIQVHHLAPVAKADGEYVVDPVRDLRPVCANCHAVIHLRQDQPYSVEEIKAMLELSRGKPKK